MTNTKISGDALSQLFGDARTYNGWLERDVDDSLLKDVYSQMKWAPTSANCSPARLIFVKGDAAKQKLKPALDDGNVDKTMGAPVVAIIANDMEFYEKLPELFPHADAKSWFVGNDDLIKETAMRNGTLQGAYLIMAARALGLDCGPMSGFDKQKVKEAFFPDENWEANFLCNLGYGDPESLFDRAPRLDFDEACEIL
ncbi:MAG: malonic semialdehyde reductase [Micavibrio sp.]|nr:malonic semialdehyde reductase [Micavibrio sp.]|tara:strand:- start:509257 stop:509850 length:594 start_codon:yes stop_codon:yes gene_type:complete